MSTVGIHWIVTTHGTWLHGDPRGSWHRGHLIGPDPFLEEYIKGRMTQDAVVMSPAEMAVAADSFGATAREYRHVVFAATVQPTHAHVIFAPIDEAIHTVIARLKRRSAVAVLAHRRAGAGNGVGMGSRETGARMAPLSVPRSLWGGGQFPVFIFDNEHLHNAIGYVRRHHERVGMAADPYDWITPGT